MNAFLRSLIAGVLYPLVPIAVEVIGRVSYNVRLETWVITAVVYFAAVGLASSSRVVSELSLWFTGLAAVAYGTIALGGQLEDWAKSSPESAGCAHLLGMLDQLPVKQDGAKVSGVLILAFTLAYGVERFRRHVLNGQEF
jgi:hypothetical protein